MILFAIGLSLLLSLLAIRNNKYPIILENYAVAIIVFISIGLYVLNKILAKRSLKILAKQSMFWDIPASIMLEYNKDNIVKKPKIVKTFETMELDPTKKVKQTKKVKAKSSELEDYRLNSTRFAFKKVQKTVKIPARNEVREMPIPYLYEEVETDDNLIEKELGKLIYSDIRKYNYFTVISELDYFTGKTYKTEQGEKSCSFVFQLIYYKMYELNYMLEKNLDFEKLLKENNYIAQFFLMDLWERIAKDDIIGVSSLYAIAKDKKDLDLVGACDSLINSNIVRDGIELLAHYYNFKGKVLF